MKRHGRGYFGEGTTNCDGCGRPITKAERLRKHNGIFCSPECAASSLEVCGCEKPIQITDEDGDVICFKCGRPSGAGVGNPSMNPARAGGIADSGAGAGFTPPDKPAPDDFDYGELMEEAA